MNRLNVEKNAQVLYFNYPQSYFVKGDSFKEIRPFCFPLIGRLIFNIVDFFKKGAESKKVHDLALETLKTIEGQMDETWPKWHFNGDESFGMYSGCPVDGKTYKELAERISKKHPLKKYQDIQDKAQSIINKFDHLAIFDQFPELTRREMIRQATYQNKDPNSPSITAEELEQMLKMKKNNPESVLPVILF